MVSTNVDIGSARSTDQGGRDPIRRRPMTAAEEQALKLERLLANPDKEIHIPPSTAKEKTLRAPREMMKNVSGSSAGAGSGEFHIYKHSRRREYERVKLMEDASKQEQQARDFAERQRAQAEEIAAKTDKNRAKRDKKKAARAAAKEATRQSADSSIIGERVVKRPIEGLDEADSKRRKGEDVEGRIDDV